MAIKRGIHKTLAEVGKIKIGKKGKEINKNGKTWRQPVKLDYFLITTTERDSNGDFVINRDLQEKLGGEDKKIRELRIRLPFDSIDKNFFTEYQAYNGGKRVCSGDGEKATRRGNITVTDDKYPKLDIDGTDPHQVDCDPNTCPIFQANKCKVSGILSAFLPDAGNLGGVYKFRTHSIHGVSAILGALEFFSRNTGGVLQGLPLKLVLVKKATADHGNILHAAVVLDEIELHGLRTLAIEENKSRLAIGYNMAEVEAQAEQEGFFIDKDPEADIEGEFYTIDEDEAVEESDEPEKEAAEDKLKQSGGVNERKGPASKKAQPEESSKPAKDSQPEIF